VCVQQEARLIDRALQGQSLTEPGFVQNSDPGFPDFSRRNYFFQTFWSTLFIFMWTKNITKLAFKRWNFLYNVFFYSKYRMGLKFLNSELQMLCVMNCKKINKCIGNQQCNRHLYFPGQHYSFQGFFKTFPYPWSFSTLFKALKISTLNSRTFPTYPGSVRTLHIVHATIKCIFQTWLFRIQHLRLRLLSVISNCGN